MKKLITATAAATILALSACGSNSSTESNSAEESPTASSVATFSTANIPSSVNDDCMEQIDAGEKVAYYVQDSGMEEPDAEEKREEIRKRGMTPNPPAPRQIGDRVSGACSVITVNDITSNEDNPTHKLKTYDSFRDKAGEDNAHLYLAIPARLGGEDVGENTYMGTGIQEDIRQELFNRIETYLKDNPDQSVLLTFAGDFDRNKPDLTEGLIYNAYSTDGELNLWASMTNFHIKDTGQVYTTDTGAYTVVTPRDNSDQQHLEWINKQTADDVIEDRNK